MREQWKNIINERTVKPIAMAGILLVTVVWGSTFVVTKNSMDVIAPTYLLAYRFTIAVAGLTIIFWKVVRSMSFKDLKYGCILGVLLFISYYFQTYGLKFTTASKNAFITTLYVIIVPFLHWLFNRVKPRKNNLIAAVIAVIGLALITLKGDLSVNLGDLLTFICSFLYALHMVFVDRYTACYNPVSLTVVQMGSCAVISWVVALTTEGPCDLTVFADSGFFISILYLGTIASMLCFLLQTVGQKFLSPNTTSILLSFEAVFGLIFSLIFLNEEISPRMLVGCAFMFSAAILAEYRPHHKKKRIVMGTVKEK